ncbi:MAG: hypothetical protein LBH64_00845 [Coriobacteriales bacterium]|nr:hypothetical protein [Coriobacteriales bacterium]
MTIEAPIGVPSAPLVKNDGEGPAGTTEDEPGAGATGEGATGEGAETEGTPPEGDEAAQDESTPPEGDTGAAGTGGEGAGETGEAGPGTGGEGATGTAEPTEGGEGQAVEGSPEGEGEATTPEEGVDGSPDDEAQAALSALGVQAARDHPPLAEDAQLWSFVYATAREARIFDQQGLFLTFRQLELNYEHRYGYPYTALLPLQPTEPEQLDEVEYSSLTPLVVTTRDHLLYIYDLPSGERLILYLDPNSLRCLGFNLQRY